MEQATHDEAFEWAIVEVYGHRRHAGRVLEVERFGAKMLRVDVPTLTWIAGENEAEGRFEATAYTTHFYGGSAIFSYTPTDEDSALRINRPYVPASRYALPPAQDDAEEEGPFFV